MLNNRDLQRTNKANKAVKACLFGKITKDTLTCIQANNSQNTQHENSTIESLLNIADSSNDQMINHFCISANSISKESCLAYARGQHSLILGAMRNKETIKSVKSISPYVIDEELITLYDSFHRFLDINGKTYSIGVFSNYMSHIHQLILMYVPPRYSIT